MKLRVVAGTLRGRLFNAPKGRRTHPMGEKVRGALFNMLGDITGLTLLDCYAGSGAIAFEAISRGAVRAVAVDSGTTAYKTLSENIESLGISDKVHATRANVITWSANNSDLFFDIVVCDPPYDRVKQTDFDQLSKHILPNGTLVLSLPSDFEMTGIPHMKVLAKRSYAAANLLILRKV